MGGRVEIERKFAVAAGFSLPDLTGVGRAVGVAAVGAPQTFTQEAVYYDSEDLRLARGKITLRRRTGGTDDGWHLKLPAGAGAREEIHRPLTAGEPDERGVAHCAPPANLLDIVFLALRGARVTPVARLVTTRTATALLGSGGVPLVEIVDDDVHAQTLGERTVLTRWREVEVELLDAALAAPPGAAPKSRDKTSTRDETGQGKPGAGDAVKGRSGKGKKPGEGKAAKRKTGEAKANRGKPTPDGPDEARAAKAKAAKATAEKARAGAGKETKARAGEVADAGVVGPPAGLRLLDAVEEALRTAGATDAPHGSKLAHVLSLAQTAPPAPEPAARARRRPGRELTAGDVLLDYLAEQVAALLAVDPRVRMDEPDAVHKMRVATRRMRSTLRTFSALFPADLVMHLDVELGDLAGALSGARDSEVQLEYFSGRLAALPPELVRGPVEESLSAHLSSGMAAGRETALAALRDERYLILLVDLADLVRAPLTESRVRSVASLAARPSSSLGRPLRSLTPALTARARRPAVTELPRLLAAADRRLARKVATAAQTPAGHERDELLHSARKQAKRLRYAGEAVEPVFGADARTLAKLSSQAQELLGIHQDATVATGLLRSWGLAAQEAGEPTAFTYGLLLGLEELRARTAEREFFDAWPALSDPSRRRWLQA